MLCGKLFLSGLENISSGRDASLANMEGKKNLEKLTLKWNGDANNSQVARVLLDKLMPYSSIKYLKIEGYCGITFPNWLVNPSLSRLESLSLSSCQCCHSLPTLGQLRFLQSLEILGMHRRLALTQDFYGDVNATKTFPSLKKFRIEKLPEWERRYIPEGKVFNRLEVIRIIDCPKLIGELLQQLPSLQILEISGCGNLVCPNGRLSILNGEIQQKFSSLRRLKISTLKILKELPLQLIQLSTLEKLMVDDCGSLSPFYVSRLPASLKLLTCKRCCNLELEGGTLECLKLDDCDFLKVNVEWHASFPMLKQLSIIDCKSIELLSIPATAGIRNQRSASTISSVVTSLQFLDIVNCDGLLSFPEAGLAAPNLTVIFIKDCEKFTSLPQRMGFLLPSLRYLKLENYPEIECFPEGGLPSSLQALLIINCKELMRRRREWGLEKLPSLTELGIVGFKDGVESFPEEGWQLSCTLQSLCLGDLENLKVLNYSGLQHITSLQELVIGFCYRLQSLPEEGLPASLTTQYISDCPMLKPRLEWRKGQDWPKVACIPYLIFDRELVP